jgi:uncharacterized protein (TIGR02147 family)
MKTIFDFKNYKDYLVQLGGAKNRRTGFKSSLAKAANCNSTYISQILSGHTNFSLEQAEQINHFLNHTPDEGHYFLLMVQLERAGTAALKKYFKNQVEDLIEKRNQIQGRLEMSSELTIEDKAKYYSSWLYSAVHMAITIPVKAKQLEFICETLNITPKKLEEILQFLLKTGLIQRGPNGFIAGTTKIHLGNDSADIIKHHSNWRIEAIKSLEIPRSNDVHYSAVASIGAADMLRLREVFLEFIRTTVKEIGNSPEEELCVFNLDFFSLNKKA